jgi:hypothetical protein
VNVTIKGVCSPELDMIIGPNAKTFSVHHNVVSSQTTGGKADFARELQWQREG